MKVRLIFWKKKNRSYCVCITHFIQMVFETGNGLFLSKKQVN